MIASLLCGMLNVFANKAEFRENGGWMGEMGKGGMVCLL